MAKQLQEVEEEIEGLDDGADLGRTDYPIDSVLIRSETRTVFEVNRRLKEKKFVLDPDFQRDFVWSEIKQSRLIESLLMRIPLPVFYLAEQNDGRMVVVDGLQRLTTFQRFLNNEFALQGTDAGATLNGKYFKDLIPKLQNRIEDANLILYAIDSKVPERVRLDIFDRVNSGVPLSRQQMRNSLYNGPATRWLKEQAIHADFLRATDASLNAKTMRDREVINRFCAFSLIGFAQFQGEMDDFLAETLKRMNQLPAEKLEDLAQDFQKSMRNNYAVFGHNAFRKISEAGRRGVLNVALFDILSVSMAGYGEGWTKKHGAKIQKALEELMRDEAFKKSVTASTNSIRQVTHRFIAWDDALKGI